MARNDDRHFSESDGLNARDMGASVPEAEERLPAWARELGRADEPEAYAPPAEEKTPESREEAAQAQASRRQEADEAWAREAKRVEGGQYRRHVPVGTVGGHLAAVVFEHHLLLVDVHVREGEIGPPAEVRFGRIAGGSVLPAAVCAHVANRAPGHFAPRPGLLGRLVGVALGTGQHAGPRVVHVGDGNGEAFGFDDLACGDAGIVDLELTVGFVHIGVLVVLDDGFAHRRAHVPGAADVGPRVLEGDDIVGRAFLRHGQGRRKLVGTDRRSGVGDILFTQRHVLDGIAGHQAQQSRCRNDNVQGFHIVCYLKLFQSLN